MPEVGHSSLALIEKTYWRSHPGRGLPFRVLDRTGDRLLHLHAGGVDTIHTFQPMESVPNLLLARVPLWGVRRDGLVFGTSAAWVVESWSLDVGSLS